MKRYYDIGTIIMLAMALGFIIYALTGCSGNYNRTDEGLYWCKDSSNNIKYYTYEKDCE